MNILNVNNEMVTAFILAAICGLAIRIVLSFSDQKWVNTYHYTLAFILLPVITLTITKIIANNIALALGMVGALSIVRFRNPVKNPFELVLYFLLITIGICMSVRSIYGIGLTSFAIIVIYSTFLVNKYFKNFFSMSFTEGKSQHLLEITSTNFSFFSKKFEIFDFVKLGAIQFTLMLGANSAANDTVSASTAPLAEATIL